MKAVVIISTYNGAKNIERQLNSIFLQKNIDVSVLIRDDGSKDNTIKVIKKYIVNNPDKKIELIEGENIGYAKSFWLGLKQAEDSDYYAFSDQDDVWKSDKLIKCISAMNALDSIPQLSYCKMQRSDENLSRLREQVHILTPDQLSKKLTLIKTYNYGAATVINKSAKDLVCRVWPRTQELPHDMWIGIVCYWFGKIYYIDEELYYWIRYNTSVTGEGTKKSGINYRIKQSFNKKSYPNVCEELLNYYSDILMETDKEFLLRVKHYKTRLTDKIKLLFDISFVRPSFLGTIVLKIGILMNWL